MQVVLLHHPWKLCCNLQPVDFIHFYHVNLRSLAIDFIYKPPERNFSLGFW